MLDSMRLSRLMPWLTTSPWPTRLLMWLFILLAAQQLALFTWRLWPGEPSADLGVPLPARAPASIAGEGRDLAALQALALFGKPEVKQAVQTPSTNAPPSRLNVQLTGLLASGDPALSLAIIAQGGKQASYGIGDVINGTQARITRILPDRVIVERQGQEETLWLDEGDAARSRSAVTPAPAASIPAPARRELLKEPGKLLDYLSISPVQSDGAVQGYRLNPGKDPALFTAVGLQPNDLAVSLNGFDLRDNAQAMQIMQQLANLNELNITVEREGQLHDVYVSLDE